MKKRRAVDLLREFINEELGPINALIGGKLNVEPRNMRLNKAYRRDGQNINTMDLHADVPQASCCLVTRDDGMVLGVSRKHDKTAWGLPGGKVDPGEDFEQAAKRELKEETGLDALYVQHVFEDMDGPYYTTTFACDVAGKINVTEEGDVRWVTVQDLLDGPFGEYNRKLFKSLGRI